MKRLSAVVLAAVILSIVAFGGIIAYAYEFIGSEIYYEDNTYDVYCSEKYEIDPYNDSWYFYNSEKTVRLHWNVNLITAKAERRYLTA